MFIKKWFEFGKLFGGTSLDYEEKIWGKLKKNYKIKKNLKEPKNIPFSSFSSSSHRKDTFAAHSDYFDLVSIRISL